MASRPDGAPPRAIAFSDPGARRPGSPPSSGTPVRPGDAGRAIAVLARTNAQLQPVAAALTKAGIPHRRRAGPVDDAATAAALVELRSVTGPGSLRAWLEDTLGGGRLDRRGPGRGPRRGHWARRAVIPGPSLPAAFVRAAEDLLGAGPGRRRAHAAGLAHRRRPTGSPPMTTR